MFEDGPPPLPPSLPSDSIPDSSFADLSDDNRLTAVIDDEILAAENPLASPSLPDFEPHLVPPTPPTPPLPPLPTPTTLNSASFSAHSVAPESTTANAVAVESTSKLSCEPDSRTQTAVGKDSDDETGIVAPEVSVSAVDGGTTASLKEENAAVPAGCLNTDLESSGTTDDDESLGRKNSLEKVPEVFGIDFEGEVGLSLSEAAVYSVHDGHLNESDETSATVDRGSLFSESSNRCEESSVAQHGESRCQMEEVLNDQHSKPSTAESGFVVRTEGDGLADEGVPGVAALEAASTAVATADEDDDFGDFEEFGGFVESATVSQPAEVSSNRDDWDAFGATSSVADVERKSVEEDDWVADFSATPPVMSAESSKSALSSRQTSFRQESIDSVPDADRVKLPCLREVFDESDVWEEVMMDDTLEVDDDGEELENAEEFPQEGIVKCLDAAKSNSQTLVPWEAFWLAVSIIEEALALKLQWSHSSSYAVFLESLSMDANLATARHSNLPAFAQQLDSSTVLRPVSFAESLERKPDSSISRADSTRSPVSPATPDATSAPVPRAVPVDSLAVPPVQFDWGNSGLTNPLTSASINASSTILDLDFLAANESRIVTIAGNCSSTSSISVALQKDLAALGLSSADSSTRNDKRGNGPNKKSTILEELMKKGANERRYTPSCELSLDARALHDQLPDLDYMLANVLLFPMATNR